MATINITAKGHSTVFTSKSLTVDGSEYKYTDISQIKHLAAKPGV